MTDKYQRARRYQQFEGIFRCPICEERMQLVEFKSMICPHRHTFDLSKHGHLNLAVQPSNSLYTKELFQARHRILTESAMYTRLHQTLQTLIEQEAGAAQESCLIADMGCGEGSHLNSILSASKAPNLYGIGLDLAKEGILMAAKRYKDAMWVVGDLANSPLADHTVQVILNILSPANYKEFRRVLVPGGLVVKVVPRTGYLKELREALFDDQEKLDYSNDETVSLFEKQIDLLDVIQLQDTITLDEQQLQDLTRMTPLAWSAEPERVKAFCKQGASEITIDLDILVGRV